MRATILLFASLCLSISDSSAETCSGLPAVHVQTAINFCVGLVATGFKAPRAVLPLPGGDLIVTDMGSWTPDQGSIWRLHKQSDGYVKTLVAGRLDRPNSLALGPDGVVYFSVAKRVLRFDPRRESPVLVDVIGGTSATAALPSRGRHILSGLVFDKQGNLFVSVGSSSDHCEAQNGAAPLPGRCAEGEGANALGTIRKYAMRWPGGTVSSWETYASGVRNAMAMEVDPVSGKLWQGENGRDAIQLAMPGLANDNELPHDELNSIQRGAHYGWPYCYDMNLISPEYPGQRCTGLQAPARLLPAHAAPLGMLFYQGNGAYAHSLIVTYHGYRQHGHRLVALLPDRTGDPLGRSIDLVTGAHTRESKDGISVMAPVGIAQATNGDLYFADDHAHSVFLLHQEVSKASSGR